MERPAFDLLSLHGPTGALRVAAGLVPAADHDQVRIVFSSVRAQLNGAGLDLKIPDATLVVTHSLGLADHAGVALLFDIDLEKSIIVGEQGLEFRPYLSALYIHSYGEPGQTRVDGLTTDFTRFTPHDFSNDQGVTPHKQFWETKPPVTLPTNPFTSQPTSTTKFTWNPQTSTPAPTTSSTGDTGIPTPTVTAPTDTSEALPDPGNINSIPVDPTDVGGWFVRFVPSDEDQSAMASKVESVGAQVLFMFGSEPAAYIFADAAQAEALSDLPGVAYVQADQPVTLNLASSLPAIKVPDVRNPVLGPKDPQGRVLEGQGVGVAIIDIGFDGSHPKLLGFYVPHDNNGGFVPKSAEGAYPKPNACGFDLVEIPNVFDVEVQNGVVYAADLHTGMYAMKVDPTAIHRP